MYTTLVFDTSHSWPQNMAEGVENVRSRACTRVCTYVIIVLTKTIQPFRWFQRFYKAVAHTQCIANVVSQHEVSVRSKGVCRGFLQIPPRDELTCLGP